MQKLMSILGPSAQGLGALSVIAGAIFTFDCRIMAGNDYSKAIQCYMTGLPMMGIGGAFSAGYNTFNPSLRASGTSDKPVNDNQVQRSRRPEDER